MNKDTRKRGNILLDMALGRKPAPPARKCPKCGSENATIHEDHPDTDMNEMVGKCPDCGYTGDPKEFAKFDLGGALAQHPMVKGVEKFKPVDLSKLTPQQLLNLHGTVMDEMKNRKLPADRTHQEKVQIKLSDMPSLVQAFQAVSEYQVRQPAGRAFPFVYQWHARAIPEDWTDKDAAANIENGANEPISVHADLRMERPGKGAIGWTLFTPGTQKKRDQFLKGNQVQGIPKDPHSEAWLGYRGRIPKGEAGATPASDGFIITRGKGVLTYGTQKPGFHEYFLKFTDPKLAHLNGRWIFTRTTDMWQVSKPKEQQPYVDTHTEAKDRKSASEVWQYSPVPGLEIPRADEPKSEAAQAAGPGKSVVVK